VACATTRSLRVWIPGARWSANGANAFSKSDWRASKRWPARDALGFFPPELTVEIKALACELPATLGLPLSRLSVADVARHAQRTGLVARISDSTVWRWLHEDAIRPWQHRCWIFPRDPQFQFKAARILDLYERRWQGQPLRLDEFVISTDEKTSIQARLRIHPSLPTEPAASMRVEHEYIVGPAKFILKSPTTAISATARRELMPSRRWREPGAATTRCASGSPAMRA